MQALYMSIANYMYTCAYVYLSLCISIYLSVYVYFIHIPFYVCTYITMYIYICVHAGEWHCQEPMTEPIAVLMCVDLYIHI
jgi:hypothetical protein